MLKNQYSVKKVRLLTNSDTVKLTFLLLIGSFLTGSFGGYWFSLSNIPANFGGYWHIFDFALFVTLTYVVWHQIFNEVFSWYLSLNMSRPLPELPKTGLKVAFLTAFVPGKEPYSILERTLKAMSACRYPHDTWLLDEGDDETAKAICKKYGVFHFTRKGKPYYNLVTGPFMSKTKGGNYNAWYTENESKYEFIAQIDVDFVPKRKFLTKTLGYFKDPEIAFVGTPQIYGNQKRSWIARAAAEQAFNFYGAIQHGLYGHDMPLFIGANHVVRVAAHQSIGGYSGHIVEDHLTGMKFYEKKWKSVYLPEVLAIGEGPSTWDSYFSQQMRWAYGLIDILFRHSPSIFTKMKLNHTLNYFFLQQYYFDGIAQALGVLLITLYFVFGIQSASMPLAPLFYVYLPLIVIQQIISLWLQKTNIKPKSESGLLLKGKFLSLAAWPIYMMAFFGVLTGKRLSYKVTPKGRAQNLEVPVAYFYPHLVLGTISLVGLIIGILNGNTAGQLVFFALLNTIAMFSIVATAYFSSVVKTIKDAAIFKNWYTNFRTNPIS